MPNPPDPATVASPGDGLALLSPTIEHTRDDLRRADGSAAAVVLAVVGLGAIVSQIAADLPRGVALAAGSVALPAAVTIVLALAVVWPRNVHGAYGPGSWLHALLQRTWHTLSAAYATADAAEVRSRQLWTLARIVDRKMRWLRRAAAGLAVTVIALAVTAVYGVINALV